MSEKPRLIYRAKRDEENPYFQHRRATAQDRTLTFEARGMLSYLLSQPDSWKVQPKDLEQQCKKSVVYRILGELIKHGYIDRQQERDEKKKIIAWHYIVHEEPIVKNLLTNNQEVAFKGDDEKLLPKKLEVEKLEVENQDIREYRTEEKKDKTLSAPIGTGAAEPASKIIPDVLEQAEEVVAAIADKPKKERDPVFDAVAKYIFGIDPLTIDQKAGGRIGPIAQWLNGKSDGLKRAGGKVGKISTPAKPEHVIRFAQDYKRQNPDINMPLDFIKFVETWRKWATKFHRPTNTSTDPAHNLSIPVPVVPMLLQQRTEELEPVI